MKQTDQVRVEIRPAPPALIFTREDGFVTTAEIDVETGLSFVIGFWDTPCIFEAIKLPGFVKHWLLSVLRKSWQAARIKRFKSP
jgi:hypothetical protein